jgi:hypothetical protein
MTDTPTPAPSGEPAAGSSAPSTLPDMPTTAADAVTQLAALKSDQNFTEALMNSAPSQLQRYRGLRELIETSSSDVDMAMAGELMPGGFNTPEYLEMMGVSSMLADAGLRPDLVRQVLAGTHMTTPAELALVKNLKQDKFSDPVWMAKLLANDSATKREWHLMNIVLTSPIKAA